MRDIILFVVFVAAIPYIIKRPALGVIMWVWLSVMNPHRLSWGFAYDMPWAAACAGLTFIALVITKDERRLPLTAPVLALAFFMLWMCLTSLFPFHEGSGYPMWSRVMKILLMTFVALIAIRTKKHVHYLVWIIVFSLGFYGLKGGLFTLATGGSYLVWGPGGSFIEGNNEVALAFIITIPLMRYVQIGMTKKWQRWGMTAVMVLSMFAAIGSHSRGAFLALAAMATFLWWKSRNKFGMGIALFLVGIAALSFMPDHWFERMNTIKDYGEDQSAQGRINAWIMAYNLASDRFLGGGFDIYDFDLFSRYAPNPLDVHAAHSIYFQVLGEHGWIGLLLFMSVGAFTWLAAGDAKRKSRGIDDLAWVSPLMDMVKVSMVGYAVGGAFLSLAYFDVPYYVMVIVVSTRELVLAAQKSRVAQSRPDGSARGDRFGAVTIDDERPAVIDPAPVRPRADDWRGQGAYAQAGPASGMLPGAAR